MSKEQPIEKDEVTPEQIRQLYEKYDNVRPKRDDVDEHSRLTPHSELDLQLMVTDPKWGDWNIPDELKEHLGEAKTFLDPNTQEEYVSIDTLWGLLGYFTRDLRLGNLSTFGGEVEYCKEYLDFAGECLRQGFKGSFMAALSRTISLLELSQSRGGFLRKQHNTLRSEQVHEMLEPKKKPLIPGKGKQE